MGPEWSPEGKEAFRSYLIVIALWLFCASVLGSLKVQIKDMHRSMFKIRFVGTAALVTLSMASSLRAQETSKPAATHQTGTVQSIAGNTLTVQNAAGIVYTVQVATQARIVQLAPGSTNLKAAPPIALDQIVAGDRVLVAGKSGDGNAITATQIVVMKSSDIAARNQQMQADWQKRGSGGIVSAVDGNNGTITIKSGAKSITIHTTPQTVYKRYAPGSVKYEQAVAGTLSQVAAGDHLQVRGEKSADGQTVAAEEIVSGAFQNISGLIASMDASAQTITLKDLATKKKVTIRLTPQTDLRNLPAEMGARVAMRLKAGSAAHGENAPVDAPRHPEPSQDGTSSEGSSRPRGPLGNFSLAQMLTRLPTATIADLKQGEALMVVASQGAPSEPMDAITILAGVEPLLAAAPAGSKGMTLSPWSLGNSSSGGEPSGMQ